MKNKWLKLDKRSAAKNLLKSIVDCDIIFVHKSFKNRNSGFKALLYEEFPELNHLDDQPRIKDILATLSQEHYYMLTELHNNGFEIMFRESYEVNSKFSLDVYWNWDD